MALTAAVYSLMGTLQDLLRFTSLAVEINNLQMDILREQQLLQLDDSLLDSVQLLDHPIGHYVQRAAESMWGYLGTSFSSVRYPHIHPYKDLETAMDLVCCHVSNKLVLAKISKGKSLYFLVARAKELLGLYRDLDFLVCFLKDIDSFCQEPGKAKHLEGDLVKLAYRTEDMIEGHLFHHSINSKTINFISNIVNGQPRSVNSLVNGQPRSLTGKVSFIKEIFNMFEQKNGIKQYLLPTLREIDLIKREVKRIYDTAPIVNENMQLGQNNAISLQHVPTNINEVVDVDNDGFLSVLDIVTRVPSALEIVPIVGMGGIGKTTLAQRVFDHPLTCHHFYIRAWVLVSQQHEVRDILIGLLSCINQVSDEIYGKSNGQLAEELYRSLKGKRFLIVLDNIWSTKAWDDVKRYFPDDKNGSRILLTTRLMKVADYVSPKRPPHYVNLLDVDQSWKLLQQKVCGKGPFPLEFEDVGRRIASNCKGLPLAIVVIAGVLCKIKRTRDCWEHIAKTVSSVVSSDPEQCLEVLALSYNHLPSHLKTCFLYMGAFPEDCEIEVPKLINLWMAEGFLGKAFTLTPEDVKHFLMKGNSGRSLYSQLSMESEAEDYLKELIDRNLVLVGNRSFSGKIKTCRLHDLVQDLCSREAQKEKFMHVMKRDSEAFPTSMIDQRRLSIHSNILGNLNSVPSMPLVRSFLHFSLGFGSMPDTIFFHLGFKLLRVLDIVFLRFQYFPLQILQLVQLRYLAFTATFELPVSMSKLRNLHILIIHGPWIHREHGESPTLLLEYWNMPRLRHLHTSVACYLSNPFIAKKNLCTPWRPRNLQSLSAITFSSCSKEVFSLMPLLRKLGIFESEEDYKTDISSKWLSNLFKLNCLIELKCSFFVQNGCPRNNLHWSLPQGLRKLTLSWSYVPWGNMAPVAMLPHLEVLKLKNHAFQGPEWEPSEEGFRRLKHLLIENHDLVHLEASRFQFPCLEHLALRYCKSLEEIPYGIAEIPTLELIELHYCSESAENSAAEIRAEIDGLNVNIRSNTCSREM